MAIFQFILGSLVVLGSSEYVAVTADAEPSVTGSSLEPSNATNGTCTTCRLISSKQVHKNPRPVEYRGSSAAPPWEMSAIEWEDRLELAALARIMYLYGFGSDLAAQCVIARVRDQPDVMLMNEWGFFFEETTASSLVKVRFGEGTPLEGNLIAPDGTETHAKPDVVNIGCVPVGRAIFNARPDVNSIIHAHPHAVMAVASTEEGLLPLSQAAFFLHGAVGRYKYDFSYTDEFEQGIADQFAAGKRAVMLDHHGLYAVGDSARESWFVTFHLHQACEVQLRAQSSGKALRMPPGEHLAQQYEDMLDSPDYAYDGSREWAGCVRKVNRELPGYEA